MAGGRPPKFKSAEELQEKIADYFENPPTRKEFYEGELIDVPCITITGLALHLGFESRQSLYDYQERDEFSYIIKRAKSMVENHYEMSLHGSRPTGMIFALKNMGWTDKVQNENTNIELTHEEWLKSLE